MWFEFVFVSFLFGVVNCGVIFLVEEVFLVVVGVMFGEFIVFNGLLFLSREEVLDELEFYLLRRWVYCLK